MKTNLLIEQHFHGCYGVDFNKASVEEVLDLSQKILKEGIGFIFPTLVTDSVENISRQINVIKLASQRQTSDMAKICGVHLEGIFLNPEKKGIHNSEYFLLPTVENFKKVEDDFIKIVTLAPELASRELLDYLHSRNVKVQAGHCVGGNLLGCDGVTHMYNAMSPVTHRGQSTALSALVEDEIFAEVIADGVHVSDDALKLLFKTKQMNKILLISDCLPCTHSNIKEFEFAGSKIYFDGEKATSKEGTLAGSTKLLPDIVKILGQKNLFSKQYLSNSYDYHSIEHRGEIEWDENFNIVKICS
jgi:N-acetylglucosamine-6-phosphate deacetylase